MTMVASEVVITYENKQGWVHWRWAAETVRAQSRPLSNPGKGLEKMSTDNTHAYETFALVPAKLVIAHTCQQEVAACAAALQPMIAV